MEDWDPENLENLRDSLGHAEKELKTLKDI